MSILNWQQYFPVLPHFFTLFSAAAVFIFFDFPIYIQKFELSKIRFVNLALPVKLIFRHVPLYNSALPRR